MTVEPPTELAIRLKRERGSAVWNRGVPLPPDGQGEFTDPAAKRPDRANQNDVFEGLK